MIIKELKAVIFDLDGVIVSTDEYHFQAWKKIADQEKIYFDRQINDRLRGVSRMASLEILLGDKKDNYDNFKKKNLAEEKNDLYRAMLSKLTPEDILPGVKNLLGELSDRGIMKAIGSSSRNTDYILERIELKDSFDAVVSGNDIKKSKPDPEVFLLAAKRLGISPEFCLVVEDSEAGIEAGKSAGMGTLGIGSASAYKGADITETDLKFIDLSGLYSMLGL